MYTVIQKLKPELKKAVTLVKQFAKPNVHFKVCDSFKELNSVKDESMSSVRVGIMKGRTFIQGNMADTWVKNAINHPTWPGSVRYANGVLFLDAAEPVVIDEPFIGDLPLNFDEEE